MVLNLYILRRELDALGLEGVLSDGPLIFRCAYPIPYMPGEVLQEGCLYVARSEDLPLRPWSSGHVSLICVGKPPAGYLKAPFNTLYTMDDIALDDLLRRLIVIFGSYDGLEHALQRAIDDGRPLSELAEDAQPFVKNPIHLSKAGFQNVFHVVSYLASKSPELCERYCRDFSTDGRPLQEGEYPHLDTLNQMISDKDYMTSLEFDEPSIYPGRTFGYRSLVYNIKRRGMTVAQICVDGVEHDFDDADLSILMIVGSYIEKGITDRDIESFDHPKALESVLKSLLGYHLVDEEKIASALSLSKWKIGDTYFCMVLESCSYDTSESTLTTMALETAMLLPSECYTFFEGKLVLVFNLSQIDTSCEGVLRQIAPLLRDSLFMAGISNVFSDFKEVYSYAMQASDAVRLGRASGSTEWFFHYEDYQLDELISRCEGRQTAKALCPKGLVSLLEYDEARSTDLTGLLETYLENSMSIADTARELYLHRNTCIYRLKRIDEVSHLDLEDPDVRLHLGIAFKILDRHRI